MRVTVGPGSGAWCLYRRFTERSLSLLLTAPTISQGDYSLPMCRDEDKPMADCRKREVRRGRCYTYATPARFITLGGATCYQRSEGEDGTIHNGTHGLHEVVHE